MKISNPIFKDVCDKTTNKNYINYLVKNKKTDTLIAIASKSSFLKEEEKKDWISKL